MKMLIVVIGLMLVANTAGAVDATDNVTEIEQTGHWMVIEFTGGNQLIHRISSSSINDARINIVFDLVPSKNCLPSPAVMIRELDSYKNLFDGGLFPIAYKLPNQKENIEAVKSVMSEGDI